jgi:reductive dehalogenase
MILNNLLLLVSGGVFLFFLWFAIVSIQEKEPLATKRSFLLAVLVPLPFVALYFLNGEWYDIMAWALIGLTGAGSFMLVLPINPTPKKENEENGFRLDERISMFSRLELTRRPKESEAFYQKYPEYLKADQEWQAKPGLMSPKSAMYSPITFNAADASFFTIEQLRDHVDGELAAEKYQADAKKMSTFLLRWAKKLGAVHVGITALKPEHVYTHRGRGKYYNNEVEVKHKYAIVFTVEMDKDNTATGPAGPTLMESAQQYLDSGIVAVQLAKFIRNLGYPARAHIDGNYEVVAPLVARDAGLGEIGRMGLLMTPDFGPRVRIGVVTADIPLHPTNRKYDGSVVDFCKICKKCADVCPSQAISKEDRKVIEGVRRWQINQEKCFSYWCTSGTDCGRCMSVCPYSHPNNLLHNIVRWGIKNSWLFRRFALLMDDFFYGRKPKPAKVPDWMEI